MKEKLKEFFVSVFGSRLPVKQRLIQYTLATTIVAGIFAFLSTCILIPNIMLTTPILFMIALAIIVMWYLHKTGNVDVASTILIIGICYVAIPVLYFFQGGRCSGMPVWMLLGLVFIAAVSEGAKCAIMFLIDVLINSACFYLEYIYPESVNRLSGTRTECIDILSSIIMVGLAIGFVIKLQTHSANDQRNRLLDKEKELKLAMEEVRMADQAKSDFLANMSHEIRTPINAIINMNEMVLRDVKDENAIKYAMSIDSAGRTLLALINDILDFTKIEQGMSELCEVEYQTSRLIRDCFNSVEVKAKKKNIEFTVHNSSLLPAKLYGDEIRIRQIINNLLTNAVKFTSFGSVSMDVDFTHISDNQINLIICVNDTGCGIREEDLGKLFTRFQKGTQVTEETVSGTGLGLSIVKHYVELMGGKVKVESEFGHGSTFTVIIPQKVIESTGIGKLEDKLSHTGDLNNGNAYEASFLAPEARILSVDDVKMNHDVVKMLLKQTEVQLDFAYNGVEAVKMCGKNDYDLILMDHMMPEMDGIEAFKKIQIIQKKKGHEIPVIILTANALSGAEERYMYEGFSGYLAKPINSNDLEAMVAKMLPESMVHYREKKPLILGDVLTDGIEEESELSKSIKTSRGLCREVFETLPFLNVDYALECCAGSVELYAQAVSGYCTKDNRIDLLNTLYKEKNWQEYTINMHAVKSSSLLVGALALSDHAKALELAAKDENYEYVDLNHREVLAEYKEAIDSLSNILDQLGIKE